MALGCYNFKMHPGAWVFTQVIPLSRAVADEYDSLLTV